MRNFIDIVFLILKKDLRIEFREKLNLIYVIILAISLSLIGFTFISELTGKQIIKKRNIFKITLFIFC